MFRMCALYCLFLVFSYVLNDVNIALNRPAYQHSTLVIGNINYGAENAVDGFNITTTNDGHCAVGGDQHDGPNWLVVDLGQQYYIQYVVLTSGDYIPWSLNNFIVGITTNFSFADNPPIRGMYPLCEQYKSTAGYGVRLPPIYCNIDSPPGRYVIIQEPENGYGHLGVCELEVYASFTDQNIGCYQNITVYSQSYALSNLSIESCMIFCKPYNKTYIGLQNGTTCYCGDVFENSLNESNCQVTCSGNSNQLCGGQTAFHVYAVYPFGYYGAESSGTCHCRNQVPCNIVTGECSNGCDDNWTGSTCQTATITVQSNYIGCFESIFTDPALFHPFTLSNITIELCSTTCSSAGFAFAGLSNSTRCTCGYNFNQNVPLTFSGCNVSCKGNQQQICGGVNAWSLYSVCPIGTFGSKCTQRCHCANNAACSFIDGKCPVACKQGWTGHSCNDRDCTVANGDCIGNETCETVNLKYASVTRCGCKSGFRRSYTWDICSDINECLGNKPCNSAQHQVCVNTVGSFKCACAAGFQQLRANCTDIDECSQHTDNCDNSTEYCNNTIGSYACLCKPGFNRKDIGSCVSIGESPDTKQQVAVIVGAVVGSVAGVAILALIILLIIFCLRRRKERPSAHPPKTLPVSTRDDIPLYARVTRKSTSIPIPELSNYAKINSKKFSEEFKSVPVQTKASCDYGKQKQFKQKNRFQNVVPYDQNRVVLKSKDDQSFDYINASYITGIKAEKYIATQGPKDKSVNDFWQMIFEENVGIIVMLCNLEESGKSRCVQYWPSNGDATYGKIKVTLEKEETFPHYSLRHLKLDKDSASISVLQWHFTTWPDHKVPENITSFLSFRRKVRQSMLPSKATVVHCSAGIGRTGSFMAIDLLLEKAKVENSVDVPGCVRALREERSQMVQTLVQYEFIYTAVVAEMTIGNTTITSTEFKSTIADLECSVYGKSRMENQFDVLIKQTSESGDNKTLKKTKTEPQIVQPVFIPSLKTKDAYIVKDLPKSTSAAEFWNDVPHNCQSIIYLDKTQDVPAFIPTEDKLITVGSGSISFGDKSSATFGTLFKVRKQNKAEGLYENTSAPIYANSSSGTTEVKVLHVTSLKEDSIDYNSFHSCFSEVITGNENNGSTLIISSSGISLPGFFVAACNALEMLETCKEVDIFQIVQELKKIHASFIPTLTSYKGLHDIVFKHLSTSDSS